MGNEQAPPDQPGDSSDNAEPEPALSKARLLRTRDATV